MKNDIFMVIIINKGEIRPKPNSSFFEGVRIYNY